MSKKSQLKRSTRLTPVDTIVTRFKATQKQKELTKDKDKQTNSRNPGKKSKTKHKVKTKSQEKSEKVTENSVTLKIPTEFVTTEFRPDKLKRKIPDTKVTLRPKNCLKIIGGTNGSSKRKLNLPQKETKVNKCKRPRRTSETSVSSEFIVNPQKNTDEMSELTIKDMVSLIEEEGGLDDEDFLEILTCPSPVWWEDPPPGYVEEPICARSRPVEQKSVKNQLLEEQQREEERRKGKLNKEKAEQDVNTDKPAASQLDVNFNIRNVNFQNRRSKLECLLNNIKKRAKNPIPNEKQNKFPAQLHLNNDKHNISNTKTQQNQKDILKNTKGNKNPIPFEDDEIIYLSDDEVQTLENVEIPVATENKSNNKIDTTKVVQENKKPNRNDKHGCKINSQESLDLNKSGQTTGLNVKTPAEINHFIQINNIKDNCIANKTQDKCPVKHKDKKLPTKITCANNHVGKPSVNKKRNETISLKTTKHKYSENKISDNAFKANSSTEIDSIDLSTKTVNKYTNDVLEDDGLLSKTKKIIDSCSNKKQIKDSLAKQQDRSSNNKIKERDLRSKVVDKDNKVTNTKTTLANLKNKETSNKTKRESLNKSLKCTKPKEKHSLTGKETASPITNVVTTDEQSKKPFIKCSTFKESIRKLKAITSDTLTHDSKNSVKTNIKDKMRVYAKPIKSTIEYSENALKDNNALQNNSNSFLPNIKESIASNKHKDNIPQIRVDNQCVNEGIETAHIDNEKKRDTSPKLADDVIHRISPVEPSTDMNKIYKAPIAGPSSDKIVAMVNNSAPNKLKIPFIRVKDIGLMSERNDNDVYEIKTASINIKGQINPNISNKSNHVQKPITAETYLKDSFKITSPDNTNDMDIESHSNQCKEDISTTSVRNIESIPINSFNVSKSLPKVSSDIKTQNICYTDGNVTPFMLPNTINDEEEEIKEKEAYNKDDSGIFMQDKYKKASEIESLLRDDCDDIHENNSHPIEILDCASNSCDDAIMEIDNAKIYENTIQNSDSDHDVEVVPLSYEINDRYYVMVNEDNTVEANPPSKIKRVVPYEIKIEYQAQNPDARRDSTESAESNRNSSEEYLDLGILDEDDKTVIDSDSNSSNDVIFVYELSEDCPQNVKSGCKIYTYTNPHSKISFNTDAICELDQDSNSEANKFMSEKSIEFSDDASHITVVEPEIDQNVSDIEAKATEYVAVYKIISEADSESSTVNIKEINNAKNTEDIVSRSCEKEIRKNINHYFRQRKIIEKAKSNSKRSAEDANAVNKQDDLGNPKKSILISEDVIKYCLVCSSIFDTDECKYCMTQDSNTDALEIYECDSCKKQVHSKQEIIDHFKFSNCR